MPLPAFFLLILAGLALLYFGRRKLGRLLCTAALVGLYLCSISPVAYLLAKPLEYAFPPYEGQPVDAVVVLGGYHRSDPRVPITSLLSATSMVRLSEGLRILEANPDARLCLSGYGGRDEISNAEAMSRVAIQMGVAEDRIIRRELPQDTRGEAQAWSQTLAGQRVALVTSAMHLPRAMWLFREFGMSPLAAPTNFQSGPPDLLLWKNWIPSAKSLYTITAAWHEYLGLAWARLQSKNTKGV